MGDTCSNELVTHQAERQGYGIDNVLAPGDCDVLILPDQLLVSRVNTLLGSRYQTLATIDIPENMIWNIETDRLQGEQLDIIAVPRDIIVDWVGGGIPFSYLTNHEVWIRILDGMAVIMIYSRRASPLAYQQDFYLLKET
jgi:hypothetical protein